MVFGNIALQWSRRKRVIVDQVMMEKWNNGTHMGQRNYRYHRPKVNRIGEWEVIASRGLPYMTSPNFLDFLDPSPLSA